MKVVIEIPEDIYKEWKFDGKYRTHSYAQRLILDGTPLPEHHGRLVDIDKIYEDRMESDNPIIELTVNREYIEAVSLDYLNSLPTIIEADKEEQNANNN